MLKRYLRSIRAKIYIWQGYLANVFLKNSSRIKVVIFAQGRTGSTLLEDLLCSTGKFKKHGELLGKGFFNVHFPFSFISGLSKISRGTNFIFHLKVYHLSRDRKRHEDPHEFLSRLAADGWKIIYLSRSNILRHSFSNIMAEARGHFHKFDDSKEDHKFYIDIEKFESKVQERISFMEEEVRALQNLKYCSLNYEKDLQDSYRHQNTVDKVFGFLGLERAKAHSTLRRINKSSFDSLISNYEEFESMIRSNNWSIYLE